MDIVATTTTPAWGFADLQGPLTDPLDNGLQSIQKITIQSVKNFLLGMNNMIHFVSISVIKGLIFIIPDQLKVGKMLQRFIHYRKHCRNTGMIDRASAPHMDFWKGKSKVKTQMIPTQHCNDTQAWRKELIRAADENIVLSGNYCGGRTFDELLILLKQQMERKPQLRVVILSSPNFIKDEFIEVNGEHIEVQNSIKIEELKDQYPDRFSLVENPDVWMYGAGMKRSTNHTKYLGIDWGRYYILGGSAVKDNFNMSGVDHVLGLMNLKHFESCNNMLLKLRCRMHNFGIELNKILSDPNSEPFVPADYLQHLKAQQDWVFVSDSGKEELVDVSRVTFETDPSDRLASLIVHNLGCISQVESVLREIDQDPGNATDKIMCRKQIERIHAKLLKLSGMLFALDMFYSTKSPYDYDQFLAKLKLFTSKEEGSLEDAADLSLIPNQSSNEIQMHLEEIQQQSEIFNSMPQEVAGGVVDSGVIGMIVPGNFRDMDFVFHNPEGERSPGRKLFLQMMTLAFRWEQFNAATNDDSEVCRYAADEAPYFPIFIPKGETNEKPEMKTVHEDDSALVRLMKTPMKHWKKVKAVVANFHGSKAVAKEGKLRLLYSGPEQPKGTSDFRREIVRQIEKANQEIVIDHMYFHPTTDVKKALVEAASRGVKIKIITCGVHPTCPNGQLIFAPRNRHNYIDLVKKIPEEMRENVEVYEFTQKKKGLHKKVMIFDRSRVLAGSSNLGYKSLKTSSDHEVNFLATSKKFAKATYKVCAQDMKLSTKVDTFIALSIKEYAVAGFHKFIAPLIG